MTDDAAARAPVREPSELDSKTCPPHSYPWPGRPGSRCLECGAVRAPESESEASAGREEAEKLRTQLNANCLERDALTLNLAAARQEAETAKAIVEDLHKGYHAARAALGAAQEALVDLIDLVVAWQTGPLMSHITWKEHPPALVRARAALSASRSGAEPGSGKHFQLAPTGYKSPPTGYKSP